MNNKYYCRTCRGHRNHKILFEKKINNQEEEDIQWSEQYRTIECLGCETVSFLKIYGDEDMYHRDYEGNIEYYTNDEIYPYFLEDSEELKHLYLIPEKIRNIYIETISAFKSKAFILTAGGLRATIEAICNNLKVKAGNLSIRIDQLHQKGFLTLNESKRLHSIRFLGNDALHEIETPNETHLKLLLEIVNHLLANLFINDKRLEGRVDTIIDTYDDFFKILKSHISTNLIGKEYTLNQILDKSKRRVPKEQIILFEQQLIDEIKLQKISFLEIKEEKKIDTIYIITEHVHSLDFIF